MYWVRALLAFSWLVSIVPASVLASPEYSPTLRRVLELPCDPTCLVCHTEPEGGFATANTKLGITLRQRFDAECCDTSALETILVQLEQAQVDSDGDGVSDVAELRVMSDPNVPGGADAGDAGAGDAGAELACQPAAHSDACSVEPGRSARFASWASVWLGCALLALRRRQRARRHA